MKREVRMNIWRVCLFLHVEHYIFPGFVAKSYGLFATISKVSSKVSLLQNDRDFNCLVN